MNTTHTDEQILHHRTLRRRVLGCDELVTARRHVQELYADQADALRRANACARHYGGRAAALIPEPREAAFSDETWAAYERTVRDVDRSSKRIAEADEHAHQAFRAWAIADHAYHQRRAELLAAAGVDERISGTELSVERAQREAFEHVLLTCPPIGWGMKKYTSPEQRAAAWQTRPAFERRTCLCPRVQPEARAA